MAIIGFDTVTKMLAIGLEANGIIYQDNEIAERKHAELLFVKIEKLLKQADVNTKEIQAVACGLGPGSFIGSRIGVTAAKTMAQVLGIHLVASPTLDIIAQSCTEKNLLVATDAMRGEIFYAFYENGKRQGNIDVGKPEKLKLMLKNRKLTVCGDAIDKFPKVFNSLNQADSSIWYPLGQNLINLAQMKIKESQFEDPFKLIPIYVREVDARESYL